MLDPDILIQHYLEGTLTEAEAGHLHRLLEARPELGEKLIQHLEIDAMLRDSNPLVAQQIIPPALPPKRRFTVTTISSIAALAACITLLATWLLLPGPKPVGEATTASVAVLRRGVDLEWESATLTPGTPLSPGPLKLKSGIAQIEFYQGARMVIEGPAEFQLLSSGEATCIRGKLTASVPPQARGFRINTPKGSVVDLGTEFGLHVSDTSSEVHVFEGEIELHKTAAPIMPVKEGQAVSFAGDVRILAANPESFASLKAINARADSSDRQRFKRWQTQSAGMNSDPGLKLHFDFQDGKNAGSLRNHAPQGEDGSIVGTAWTEGRWPGKGALEFRNLSDRVRLGVPGEIKALTMVISVRVNGLDRTFNSLFMSDGWNDRQVHWQIMGDGRISLGVAAPFRTGIGHSYNTPVYFTPERLGSWVSLAVVFDPVANEVRHYASGTLLARQTIEDNSPLKIGNAELGNWNNANKTKDTSIRHLSGAMDEFALWDRALDDAEIESLTK